MELNLLHIVILSEHSFRAESLATMIRNFSENSSTVTTILPSDFNTVTNFGDNPIFLIDLMGCENPPLQIIKKLKSEREGARIIALHMYRHKSLIEPIFKEGVDGYLFYEPSRAELAEALSNVQKGEKFKPAYPDT